MMDLYLLKKGDGLEYGPLTADQVRECILGGEVFARTLIRREGEADWRQLTELADFSEALRQPANQAGAAPAKTPMRPNPPRRSEDGAEVGGERRLLFVAGTALAASLGAWVIMPILGPLGFALLLFGFGCTVASAVGIVVVRIRRGKVPGATRNLGCAAMFVWFLVIGILVPSSYRSKSAIQKDACINNLRQLDGAMEQWALQFNKRKGDVAADKDLIGPKGYIKIKPVCPSGGKYSYGKVGERPVCTILGHTLE